MKYTKHLIAEMGVSLVQRCLLCGEIITDERNAMRPAGSPEARGFQAGEIWVSEGRNPRITTIIRPDIQPEEGTIKSCTP